jgi:hypothetical protein
MAINSVGAVYVKVFADSSGFKKDLEKDAKTAGGKAADHFGDEFDKKVTKDLKNLQLDKTLGPQVKEWGRKYADQVNAAVKNGTRVDFKLGDFISVSELKRLERQLGVPFKELADYLQNEIPQAAKDGFGAIDKENAESLKTRQQQYARYVRWQQDTDRKMAAARRKEAVRIRPMSELLDDKAFKKSVKKMAKDFSAIMTPEMRKALKEGQKVDWVIHKDVRRSLRQISKDSNATFRDVEKQFDRMIRKMVTSSKQVGGRGGLFGRLRVAAQDSDRWVEKLDLRIGKMRNGLKRAGTGGFFDTLTNIFAGLIGMAHKFGKAVVNAVDIAAKGLTWLGGVLTKASASMGKFGGMAARAGGMLSKMGKLLKNPIVAVIALTAGVVAGLQLLQSVMGSVVTLMVDLAGMFSMLAAGIGASVVAAAALVPIAISLGAGLAALAIGGMDAAKAHMSWQKAMAETDPKKRAQALAAYRKELAKLGPNTRAAVEATNELVGSFADFKKEMSEAMFGAGVQGLAKALKAAQPMVDALKTGMLGVSKAVGDVLDKFLRLGQDNRFMEDFNTLWTAASGIVRNVGTSLVNFFAGLTSFFAIVAPYAERLAEWIRKISENFRTWAQSDEGREKMKTFFADAWALAKQFWDVLASLTGVVVAFFKAIIDGPEGGEAGGFLKDIADWLDRLKTTIEEMDKDGRLKKWFEDAKVTGKALWDTLKGLGNLLKDLNTPENREFLQRLIGLMKTLISVVRIVFTVVSFTFRALVAPIMAPYYAIKLLWSWIQKLIDKIKQIKWPTPPAWMKSIGSKLSAFMAEGGVVTRPTRAMIGEAGPEAVIPLARPLSLVDPSVRGMAAMLRGGPGSVSTTNQSSSRQMTNYWTINTPTQDPRVVASQVVNRMAAMAG